MILSTKKKLLVLDVNGLLVQRFFHADKLPGHCSPDGKVGKFYVYKRPYCREFLTFCFEKFQVGLWSSAQQHNVQYLVDFVFGDLKSKLVFTWHQSDCTDTGLKTPDNKMKPVFLKELYKLWSKLKPDLPWAKGDYGPFNTLLIDDTPYKAMCNPPYTAIFPDPYEVSNDPDDALAGALRKYLEGIAGATNVQDFVKYHPFGQLPISKESPQWHFYCDFLIRNSSYILETNVKGVAKKALPSIACNNGSTQSSSSQQCSVPCIEREDDGLDKISVSCMMERNGSLGNSLTQKHFNFNGLEENVVAKVTNSRNRRRRRRISVMEPILNQEHEAHNRSVVDKEAAFGIYQQSDLDVVSKDYDWSETAVTCTTERNGAIVRTLSQKHVSLDGLEENGVAKATNPWKKRRNNVMEAGLNQEHGAHNRSVVDREASFDISRQSDLDMVSKEDDRSRTVRACTMERNGAIVSTLNEKLVSFNGLEENGVAKGINPRKERRNSDLETPLNQEHEAHYRSVVGKEASCGISRQSDLDMVSKDDGACETVGTCMTERIGATITTTNKKHATSGNNKVDSQIDKYNVGNNTLERSGRDFHDLRCSNRGHHIKSSNFNKDYRDGSSHRQSYSFHSNNVVSRTCHSPKKFEGNWRHQNDVNATLQTKVAQAGTSAQTNTGGSRTSHFSRKFERNCKHQTDANSTIQKQVAQDGAYAQISTGGSQASYIPRNWRHQNDANAILQTQVAKTGTYAQTNNGGNRTYHNPRNFEGSWRHQNHVSPTIQTQVAEFSTYTNNNGFGRSVVPENLVGYPHEGYTNGRHYQSRANQHSHFWDGSYGAHYKNHNCSYSPQLFSHHYHPYYKADYMRRKSNDRKTYHSSNRF